MCEQDKQKKSLPPTPHPMTPRPLIIVVWESVPTKESGNSNLSSLNTTLAKYSKFTCKKIGICYSFFYIKIHAYSCYNYTLKTQTILAFGHLFLSYPNVAKALHFDCSSNQKQSKYIPYLNVANNMQIKQSSIKNKKWGTRYSCK